MKLQIKDIKDEVVVTDWVELYIDGKRESSFSYYLTELKERFKDLYVSKIMNFKDEYTGFYTYTHVYASKDACEYAGTELSIITHEYKKVSELTTAEVTSNNLRVILFNQDNNVPSDFYMLTSLEELKSELPDAYVSSIVNYQYDEEKPVSSSILLCSYKTPYKVFSKYEIKTYEIFALLERSLTKYKSKITNDNKENCYNDLGMRYRYIGLWIIASVDGSKSFLTLESPHDKEFYEIRQFINKVEKELFDLYA